jgi:hypothetical protein
MSSNQRCRLTVHDAKIRLKMLGFFGFPWLVVSPEKSVYTLKPDTMNGQELTSVHDVKWRGKNAVYKEEMGRKKRREGRRQGWMSEL